MTVYYRIHRKVLFYLLLQKMYFFVILNMKYFFSHSLIICSVRLILEGKSYQEKEFIFAVSLGNPEYLFFLWCITFELRVVFLKAIYIKKEQANARISIPAELLIIYITCKFPHCDIVIKLCIYAYMYM